MALKLPSNKQQYIENLRQACDQIKAEAYDIFGSFERTASITITISFYPGEIASWEVKRAKYVFFDTEAQT